MYPDGIIGVENGEFVLFFSKNNNSKIRKAEGVGKRSGDISKQRKKGTCLSRCIDDLAFVVNAIVNHTFSIS